MNCTLTTQQQEDLLVYIAGDLLDISKGVELFNTKKYILSLYDLIKASNPGKTSEDTEALALDYARIGIIYIDQLAANDRELSKSLRKFGFDFNDLKDTIDSFEDEKTGLDILKKYLNISDTIGKDLAKTQELVNIQKSNEALTKKNIQAIGIRNIKLEVFTTTGGNEDTKLSNDDINIYNLKRSILNLIDANSTIETPDVEIEGIGPVFIKIVSGSSLDVNQRKNNVYDRTNKGFNYAHIGIFVDSDNNNLFITENGSLSKTGTIVAYTMMPVITTLEKNFNKVIDDNIKINKKVNKSELTKKFKEQIDELEAIYKYIDENIKDNFKTTHIVGGSLGFIYSSTYSSDKTTLDDPNIINKNLEVKIDNTGFSYVTIDNKKFQINNNKLSPDDIDKIANLVFDTIYKKDNITGELTELTNDEKITLLKPYIQIIKKNKDKTILYDINNIFNNPGNYKKENFAEILKKVYYNILNSKLKTDYNNFKIKTDPISNKSVLENNIKSYLNDYVFSNKNFIDFTLPKTPLNPYLSLEPVVTSILTESKITTTSQTEQIKQDVDDVLAKGPADLTKDELIKKITENDNLFEKNQTLKAYNKEEAKEVIDAALDWYNSPAAAALKAAFPFDVVFAAVNSKQTGPVATWAVGGITLYQYYRDPNSKTIDKKISADYTDLYHEAWHGFTQTFLTQKQRDLMYKEASKMKGSFVAYNGNYVSFSNATKKQLDEYVAEGFRTFMISGGTIKQKETPIKNNIFQKILNFLKALFGNATVKDVLSSKETASFPAIQELYNKLRIGDLTGFTYSEGNVDRNMSPFESTIRPSLKNILDRRLSVKDSEEVFETVNSLFVKAIDDANELKKTTAFTGAFFKDEERVKLGYQYVFNEFKNVIIPRLEKELSEAKTDELKTSIQNSLNLANYVIRNDNFGDINNLKNNRDGRGIIAYHQMKSQYISNEDKEAFFNISDEETLEKGTVLFKNDDNTVSQQNLANPDINFLLNSLYLFDKNNKPVYNQFGVQKLADYSKMFSMVAKTLTGNLAIEKMWNLLNEKAETNMSIKHLMTKLGPLKSDTIRVDVPKVFTLQTLFWQSFNLTNIQLMQMNVEQAQETVNGITKYNYNITIGKSSTPSKKIGEEWQSTFSSVDKTDYIKLDPAENKNRLIINKVLEKFYPNGKFDNLNSLAFFTAIGLQFTENPAIALKINGSDEYGAIYVLKNLKVLLDNGIKINSLNDIFKEYKDLNLATLEARYNKLQELEFKYSETSYNAMVTNAEGNSQYENSLNNTLTINADAINNASTYYELIAQPYMAHLDINKNPLIGASIWMNRLFDMNSINKRKRGNIKIIIGNLSGVQIITDEKTEDGIATNAADEFTKFIQDYHLILNGTPELMRAADKTSSFTAHIQGHKLYINTDSFLDDKGFAEAHGILTKYIAAELIKINKFKDLQKKVDAGDKIIFDFNYLKEGQKFVIFEDVLTKETQNKLLNENFNDKSVTEIENLIYDNNDINLDIVKDLKNYFEGNVNGKEGQVERNRKLLNDVQGKDVLLGNNFINNIKKGNPEIDNSLVLEAALKSFTYNSFIHNLETISIFYGDIAQYKIAKEEFHKRNAGAGSTGKLFRNDKVAIDFVNSRGRGWAKRKGIKEKTLTYSGEIDTAVLEDNIIPTAYLKDITDAITEDITKRYAKATLPDNIKAERIKEEVGDYLDNMKEGDAQGWITFDMYRILAYLEGNWSDEQEKLYKKIINEEEVSITDTLTFFPVRKFQYWGTLKNEYASLNAFHKFSLMPLIPNVIKDKKLMLLHDKMMNEEIDYALFESGSKIATVTTNGIKDKFYTDKVNRDFSESNFTKNTVYLQFLKDQLEIAPKYKDKATFSTQLRKLVEIGLMEAGVPIDFSPGLDLDKRITEWNKLDSDAKLEKSANYKLIKDYESNIKKLVDLNKAKFIKDAGIEFNADGEIVVTEKFKEYLLKELSKQELAEHELAFININSETNILNDLSISLSSDKLEQILNSILINRLIKQKFKGESLVQVSGVGFESIIPKFTNATEEEKLRYAGTNDLPSYRRGMGKNGNTTACKVKIALQGDFMNLLDIIHPDGKKIETLDRLNALIQDDAWLDANNGDNRKMITMVGVRIPVQGLNSMEFMEVYEFLHPDAGTMIVLPSEIVAKTGGDFDIDKLTVLMPNIKGNFNYDKWFTKEGRAELIKLQQENPNLKDKLTPDNVNIIFDVIKNNQEDYVLDETDKAVFNLLKINSLYDVKYVKGDKTTAGLENAIVNNIKQMLELPSNYLSLVKPNGTYILKPIAEILEDDVTKYDPKYRISGEKTNKIAGTRLLEVGYNLYKHRSNNIGKQVLSIFAVSNTYNSVFNRIGMRMNNEYIFGKGEKTKFKKRLDIMFNHNIQKINGKDVISLSHLLDANNEYYIADIISQLINGSVDVAKDAWLFLIQANKEVASSLEFLIEAGVPIKQAIYFVSQPVIRDYIYEQQKAKSIIIDVKVTGKEKDNPAFHQSTARKIMLKRIFNQEMSNILDNPGVKNDIKQKYIYDETVKLTSTDKFIDFVTISAETNLLTKIKSKNQTISDIDKGLLLHFFEIEDMAKTVTSVKLATSFDTSTPIGLYEAEEKIRVSEELATNSMIPKDVLKNIIEQSPIGPFAIQDFFVKVFKGFFKFRNNDTVNNFVKDLINQEKDLILETFNNDIPDFIRTYKNSLLSFIYQNELKTFDIDVITNYKGVPVRSGVNIVTIESVMKLNSGVGVKKVDEKNIIYIDRAQLKADYTNRVSIGGDPISVDNKVISKPAKVDASAFPFANDYYRFVIEREILRANSSLDSFSERLDYQDNLKENKKINKKESDESSETFDNRMKVLTYEQLLRDLALDNTFNTWKMFKSNTSVVKQFIKILNQYPELKSENNYDIIKNLTGDEEKKSKGLPINNLILRDRLYSVEKLNIFYQDLLKLANPSEIKIKASDVEKARVSLFFDNLSNYAFFQSGMNTTSKFSIIRAIPQERILRLMLSFSQSFSEGVNINLLEKFNNVFWKNQKLFSKNRLNDLQINDYNFKPINSDFLESEQLLLTEDNKGNIIYKGANEIDTVKATIEANPNVTFLFESTVDELPGISNSFNEASKEFGNTLPLGIKPTSTTSYSDVSETEAVVLNEAVKASQSGIDKYMYYGKEYTIITNNDIGIDVVDYKGKETKKQDLLTLYNTDPNLDVQKTLSMGLNVYWRTPVDKTSITKTDPSSTNTSVKSTMTFADGTVINTPFVLNDEQRIALLELETFTKNINDDPFSKDAKGSQISLLGYAGTGKTSIISIFHQYLAKNYKTPVYSSPTHRANAVTKLKNPKAKVYTLHALFGLQGELVFENGDYDLKDLTFAAKGNQKRKKISFGDILIVDEASMVNDALYEFLELNKAALNLNIIYVGDPAQLKPPGQQDGSKALDSGKLLQLTKVERTGDNPILEESTNLRNKKDFNYKTKLVDGKGVVYSNNKSFDRKTIADNFKSKEFKTNKLYFRVLSGTNAGVKEVNNQIREDLYGNEADKQLVKGDILMGYNNFDIDYKTKEALIINSGDYEVVSTVSSTKSVIINNETVSFSGFNVVLKNLLNTTEDPKIVFIVNNNETNENILKFVNEISRLNIEGADAMKAGAIGQGAQLFAKASELQAKLAFMKEIKDSNGRLKVKKTLDYGYAHTIHKSQGGTYNKVFILADTIDSFKDPVDRQQLKYVAMSRASELVYVSTNHALGVPEIVNSAQPVVTEVQPTQLSTSKIGFDISKIAPNKKDPKKAAIATDMIGYGRDTATRKSSTKKYQDAAIAQGIPVNSGNYNQNTVAFISVSGNNVATTEDIEQTVYRAQEVLNAGGSIIMDNKDNRESSWNKSGELAVFNLLTAIVHKYNLENISKDLDYVQLKLKSIPTQSSTSVKEGVQELFKSNPELANAVYSALGFSGAISLSSNLKNTGKTEQELIEYLKKKYPEIKLNITNNPVWEQGDTIFNQEEFKKQKEDRIKELEKSLIPETNQIVTETLNKLNNNLENYLKQFGFNTEQLDDLKQATGYSIIGATDFLEKTIFVQKENINKAYTKEAAYSIFNLLGRKNLLRKDLIASIHLVDNYESLKSQYTNSKLSDYKIRELIAIDYLQNKLIEAHKEILPTTNKSVSKDVTAKNNLEYITLKIKQWWSGIVRNFLKSYKKGYIEDVFNQIANDVINNNTRLFNLSKEVSYKKMKLTGIQKEINDSLVKLGAINSGSYSLNKQGNLTRENINDLDYFLPYQIKDDFIKNVVKNYPQAVFSKPYSGVMGNRSLTLSLKINDVKIDFFLPTSQEESDKNKIIVTDGVKHHHWKNIFDAKVRIGSKKHLSDLAGFTPFNRDWSVYNVSWRNPLILKDDYLNIVGQRHYNFDFIQSKYNSKEYSSAEKVTQSDNIKTYWDKNLEKTALSYFKDNNIDFESSVQYQDLFFYFNNKKDKAIAAYYLTFSENFKKFYGNIDSRKNLPSFIINSVNGNYSKNSVLLDENKEPVIFYHGAGTMFDKFSKDYFLSGEGAMAYGAGFYSTNYKPTADNYRDTSKAAMKTFRKLLEEQNEQLLKLIEKLKIDINEENLINLMMGSVSIEDTKSKTELLNLLGLSETKALYITLTNPLYWQKDISKENKNLIESHFNIKLKNTNSGQIYRELEKTLKISGKELSARLYQMGIDGAINIAGGGQAVGGFSHEKGEKHVIFFEPVQAKAVNNSGLFSLNNENMYDPIEVKENKQFQVILTNEQKENNNKINNEINQLKQELVANVLLQRNEANQIIGQANIKAMTVLIDAVNKKEDTIPHEYAHHYIAWFRDSAIVQEGIKRFGSEEALVQKIGEQVVVQKGEAYNWWKKFTNFILNLLSDKQLLQVLTDSFINRTDLNNDFTYNNLTPQQKQEAQQLYSQYLESLKKPNTNPILQGNQQEQVKKFAELQERLNNKEFIEGAKNAYESSEGLQKNGTQEQYNGYIARVSLGILKNPSSGKYNYTSKVKDVVYRGDEKELSKFTQIDNKGNFKASKYGFNYGIFLSSDIEYVKKTYGKQIYAAVINSENIVKTGTPLQMEVAANLFLSNELNPTDNPNWEDLSDKEKEEVFNDYLKNNKKNKIDTIIGNDSDSQGTQIRDDIKGLEYVVYKPEQIHILGGKQDIEGFKQFVTQSSTSVKPTIGLTQSQRYFATLFKVEQNFYDKKPYPKEKDSSGKVTKWEVYKSKTGKSSMQASLDGERTQSTRSTEQIKILNDIAKNQGLTNGITGTIVWMEGQIDNIKNSTNVKGDWFRIISEPYTPNKSDFNAYENWDSSVWENRNNEFKIGTKDEWKSVRFERITSVQPKATVSNVITGYPQVNPIVKANIDKMIDAALQLKAKGGLIGFPSKGFGQDMLKGGVNNTPIARQTFIYLSKRLLELEFINPGFEKTLQSVDPQQDKTAIELIQEKQPITNKDVLDGLMHCFS